MPMTDNRPETLDRWEGERADWHRALLLWAMQGVSLRSFRAVARAMGCSDGSIRTWAKNERWKHRVAAHGEADQYALDLYRQLYLADFGKLELPHVLENVVRPVGAIDLDDPAAAAAELTRERARKATGHTLAEVEQAVVQQQTTKRRDNKREAERHLKLVDAALGTIARKMKANEIRVSVRDIPLLLECREQLVRVASGASTGPGIVVESSRVRYAKETGGDVLQAVLEDAEECTLILGALKGRQGVDLQALANEDQAARDALAQEA